MYITSHSPIYRVVKPYISRAICFIIHLHINIPAKLTYLPFSQLSVRTSVRPSLSSQRQLIKFCVYTTRWVTEESGFDFPTGVTDFSLFQQKHHWGPPSALFGGYRPLVSGVVLSGRERNHSSLTCTNVKNGWSCASTATCVFMTIYTLVTSLES
jgi:hypothetical protein